MDHSEQPRVHYPLPYQRLLGGSAYVVTVSDEPIPRIHLSVAAVPTHRRTDPLPVLDLLDQLLFTEQRPGAVGIGLLLDAQQSVDELRAGHLAAWVVDRLHAAFVDLVLA